MTLWSRPPGETALIGFIEGRFPRLIFSPEAAAKMDSLVSCCSLEISWYATSHTVATSRGVDYRIDDVFVAPQICSMGGTEFFEADLYQPFMGADGKISPENLRTISNLHVWGHSHVNMGVQPSAIDERQTDAFIEKISDYFIRLICNKRGDMNAALYLFDRGLVLHQPRLIIEKTKKSQNPEVFANELYPFDDWATKEILDKVTRRHYTFRPPDVDDEEWEDWMSQFGRNPDLTDSEGETYD